MLNVQELREVLSGQVEKITTEEGIPTPTRMNAISTAIGRIISATKLELEYNKTFGRVKKIGFLEYPEENNGVTPV